VRYAVAVCCVAAGLALRFALASALGPALPYITFFPAIMLAAWFGGLGPGILATLLSLVSASYLVLEANATGAILFVAVSVFISILTEALRRSRARSDERFRQLALETGRRSSAEEALAESKRAVERSEDRLKLALNAGKIGVWDWDVVRNRIEWSDLVYDIHGVERGTFRGALEDFAELVHPDDRERVDQAIRDALERDIPYDIEFRVIHPNGEVHWVSPAAQVFRNAEGVPIRMLGAVTDVTARKEAEAHLLRQWHTFDTALSNTPDFIYIFDRAGRFTYINRALLSLWQRPLEDAVGKNFFDLGYPPDLAARLQRQIQQVVDTKEPLRDHTPFTGPTGETRHYEYIFVPVFAADGQIESIAGSTRDVTGLKRAEEDLQRSNEELKRVNRELEEFAYVASHDLQEPLRTVNIYTQLLLRDIGPEREKLGQYAGFIQRGVVRMEALIRDLLTFSRSVYHEELLVGTADLAASLSEAMSVLKNDIEECAAVITAESLPAVRGDTSQMAHVFQNLLSNALKYRKSEVPPAIRVSAEPDGGHWIVSVQDNGIGFDPRYAGRIFGLFKRLHTKEYPGTGLGLAICKRIVERYGGRIWAESTPGEGAAFYFVLPKVISGAICHSNDV